MRLIAQRPRYERGTMTATGEMFEVEDDRKALDLLARGLARLPDPPRIIYRTKIVTPEAPEVIADANRFRYLSMPHEEPTPVVAACDTVLPATDPSTTGTTDSGNRRKRGRPRSR